MNVRPVIFYSIQCKRNGDIRQLDIDADSPEQVIDMVIKSFSNRFAPPKDKNGRYKKGIPFTSICVLKKDMEKKIVSRLTHGKVYNYSPLQVIRFIKQAVFL